MTQNTTAPTTGYKTSYTAVRKARRFALQGLYEWLSTDVYFRRLGNHDLLGNDPNTIAARTRATNAMHTVHLGYYHTLMREIPEQLNELELIIKKALDRDIVRLDKIEHIVLLIGTYELLYSPHIPFKVVIDEAILLNTHFGASDGFKLINFVMDKLAKELRPQETTNHSQKNTKSDSKDNPSPPVLD